MSHLKVMGQTTMAYVIESTGLFNLTFALGLRCLRFLSEPRPAFAPSCHYANTRPIVVMRQALF
jgi:hypothetical protein